MSRAKLIDDALRSLRAKGASAAEIESARGVMAWLIEHNRSECRLALGRGVHALLPANQLARGLTTRPL